VKFRIITRNTYIVDEVENFDEAWSVLKVEMKTPYEDTVKLEHAMVVYKEEVDEQV